MRNTLVLWTILTASACTPVRAPTTDDDDTSSASDAGEATDAGSTSDAGDNPVTSNTPTGAAAKATVDVACRLLACIFGASPTAIEADCARQAADGAAVEAAVAAGRITFNATKGEACVRATATLKAASCFGESPTGFEALATALSACEGAFSGTVEPGGDCYVKSECTSGLCDSSAQLCPGRCRARGGSGWSCSSDDECFSWLRCRSGECGDLSASGGECFSDDDCVDGLACNDDVCGTPSAPVGEGKTCGDSVKCASDLFCKTSGSGTGTCAKKVAEGGACTAGGAFIFLASEQCRGAQVCAGLQSTNSQVTTPGRCQSPRDVGGACVVATPPTFQISTSCYSDLVCDRATSKCAKPPAAGSACLEDRCAKGAYCADGTCFPAKDAPAACQDDDECLHGCDRSAHKCQTAAAADGCQAP